MGCGAESGDRLKRSGPPKRRSPLKAKAGKQKPRKRIKPVNPKRRKRLSAEQFGPPGYVAHVHSYGCLVELEGCPDECEGPMEAAHVKSRGAGGGWKNNLVPLCRRHHRQQHDMGADTFAWHHQIDLDLWACAITGKFTATDQLED